MTAVIAISGYAVRPPCLLHGETPFEVGSASVVEEFDERTEILPCALLNLPDRTGGYRSRSSICRAPTAWKDDFRSLAESQAFQADIDFDRDLVSLVARRVSMTPVPSVPTIRGSSRRSSSGDG